MISVFLQQLLKSQIKQTRYNYTTQT